MNAAHVLNQRIAKSFCFRPLTDVLGRKSNFRSNSLLYGAQRETNAWGLPGGGGEWAVLELTGTLLPSEETATELLNFWVRLGGWVVEIASLAGSNLPLPITIPHQVP